MKRLAVAAVLFILLLSTFAHSQPTDDLFRTMYFGRTHSASVEAMGKTSLHLESGSTSHLFNPAALQYEQGLSATYSGSGRYYHYSEADYSYLGAAVRFGKWAAFGISKRSFDTGFNDERYNEYTADLYTLSYALDVYKGISVGISVNMLKQDEDRLQGIVYFPTFFTMITGSLERKGYYTNIGMMKKFVLRRTEEKSYEFGAGISVSNLFDSKAEAAADTFYADMYPENNIAIVPDNEEFDAEIPEMIRSGIFYRYVYDPPDREWFRHFRILVAAEYYRMNPWDVNAYSLGFEMGAFDIASLRLGFFREFTHDGMFQYGGLTRYQRVTWGFGLNLPVQQFRPNLPVKLSIDYAQYGEPYDDTHDYILHGMARLLQVTVNYDFKQ